MTCPKCGAEIAAGNKFCEFCGAQISLEMQKKQEQLNKAGCPKCGSTNVVFEREKQGELKGKKGNAVIRATVGMCKDCGHTWKVASAEGEKKSKTWLWVLGWIFIFPVPLTILMLRKKEMKLWLKYGIIALAWVVYLLIALAGGGEDSNGAGVEVSAEGETSAIVETSEGSILSFTITSGEVGEFGLEKTLNKGTEFEETQIVYHIPAGTYAVENLGEYQGQIEACSDKTHLTDEGWEEPEETKSVLVIKPGETVEFSIENGFYLESHVNGQLKFTKK